MLPEIPRIYMVNTAELRQIFPLRENTLRHVVEGDGRYPRAMTPSGVRVLWCFVAPVMISVSIWHGSCTLNPRDELFLGNMITYVCAYLHHTELAQVVVIMSDRCLPSPEFSSSYVSRRMISLPMFLKYPSPYVPHKWFAVRLLPKPILPSPDFSRSHASYNPRLFPMEAYWCHSVQKIGIS